ncbi:hypothetical protein RRG08_046377 [Elysia crispata]|uniref:Integrase catalytic domain-containing protein n=1 Tax=Elysia crispata TaxID=231223 RepID=A0AAE1AZ32_9GAST|nr:hypothetical protein RRG08_046377 [Elysia crispata]
MQKQLRQKEVTYMGGKTDAETIQPDPEKVRLVVHMVVPENKQDMIICQIVEECLDRGHNSPILARHGIPDEMMTDDMPFNSFTMRKFSRDWNIKIITSSPDYAQSNGQSERHVQTVESYSQSDRGKQRPQT